MEVPSRTAVNDVAIPQFFVARGKQLETAAAEQVIRFPLRVGLGKYRSPMNAVLESFCARLEFVTPSDSSNNGCLAWSGSGVQGSAALSVEPQAGMICAFVELQPPKEEAGS